MIITDTEAIRSEAIKHFRVSPDALWPFLSPRARSSVRSGVAVPSLFPVCRHDWNRERMCLLSSRPGDAVRQTHDVDLVIAGRTTRGWTRASHGEPGLRILGEVPNERLASLYSGAIACLYPTEYEGFRTSSPGSDAMRMSGDHVSRSGGDGGIGRRCDSCRTR